jgi:FkbM family methyltransferase
MVKKIILIFLLNIVLNFKKLPRFSGKYRVFLIFLKIYNLISKKKYLLQKLNCGIICKLSTLSFEKESIMSGEYDKKTIDFILKKLDINKNILDVGANIGFYALQIGQHIKNFKGKGKIFAFEPHPINYLNLKHNIKINKLTNYIYPFNFGLSDKKKNLNLILREDFKNNSLTGNCSLESSVEMDKNFSQIKTKVEKIDNNRKIKLSNLGFIKVDIEGHENYFFKGSIKTIKKFNPLILFELNKKFYIEKYKKKKLNFNKLFLNLKKNKYKFYDKNGFYLTNLNKLDTVTNIYASK